MAEHFTGYPGHDEVRRAANRIADDGGQTGRQRFVDDQAPRLTDAGQHETVRGCVRAAQLALVEESGPHHARAAVRRVLPLFGHAIATADGDERG